MMEKVCEAQLIMPTSASHLGRARRSTIFFVVSFLLLISVAVIIRLSIQCRISIYLLDNHFNCHGQKRHKTEIKPIWWYDEQITPKRLSEIFFLSRCMSSNNWEKLGVTPVTRGRTDGKWKVVQYSLRIRNIAQMINASVDWVWQENSWASAEMPPHNLTMVWRADVQLSFLQETFPLGNLVDKSGG